MLSLISQVTTDTTSDAAGGGFVIVLFVIYALFIILFLVGYWKVFTKMGLPGWMGIIPIVNVYMLFKARGQREPVVWTILMFIPCINFVALWFLANDTAEIFDKELGWKIFLFIFPGISHLILGYGDSQANPANIAPGVGLNAA
jgi:hypothetical protein